MSTVLRRAALCGVSLLAAGTAHAASQTVASGDTLGTAPVLAGTDLLTVASGGRIAVNGDGVDWQDGSDVRIVNDGIIESTKAGKRAIHGSGADGLLYNFALTNGATGIIRADDDAVRSKHDVQQGQIRIRNSGLIHSVNGQAIDFDNLASTGAGQVLIENRAGGIIRSDTRDAVRPGANGQVMNAGLIEAHNGPGETSSDGIDFQARGGQVINLAGGQIIGGRHGITGDAYIEVINEAGAEIIGQNGSGVNLDGSGQVINHGLISGRWDGSANGDGDGIDIDGHGQVENFGRIEAMGFAGYHSDGVRPNGSDGVAITGGGELINHAGATIYSVYSAVWMSSVGGDTRLLNEGDISGGKWGVIFDNRPGYLGTLTNNGHISGTEIGVDFRGGGDGVLIIQQGSVIAGPVTSRAGYDGKGYRTVRLEDGAVFDTQTGFEELQVVGRDTRLTGDNQFDIVRVNAGADLRIGNADGSAGWAGPAIANAGTLSFALARDLDIAGMIAGTGLLRFVGSGTVRYGRNDFAGTIETVGQPLTVLADTAASVRALGGATVALGGAVGGLAAADGSHIVALQPDLTIAGDLQLAAGTTLQLPVVGGALGRIVVDGRARIDNAELQLSGALPDLQTLEQHVLLTAADGVSGTFVTSLFAGTGFVGALRNRGDRIDILVRPADMEFRASAQSPNQAAVADALQSLPVGNGLRDSVFWLLDPADARRAFDALSGEIHAATSSMALESQAEIGRLMLDVEGESLGDEPGFSARGKLIGS